MRARTRLLRKAKKLFRRGEPGFAMVVVLVAMLILSVLGASTMLLMVSAMQGVLKMNPEERAFQVAEAGLYVGHTKIVGKKVGSGYSGQGTVLAGNYAVKIDPLVISTSPLVYSTTDFTVTCLGSCLKDGTTYRRKLQESVYFSGDQAFDAMRNYMFFAGNNLNALMNAGLNNYPIMINGNMRAENNLNFINYCQESANDYIVVNGSLEGKNSVNIESGGTYYYPNQPTFGLTPNPKDSKGTNVCVYGDIKAGGADTSTAGSVSLYAWSGEANLSNGKYVYSRESNSSNPPAGISSLFAATDAANHIYNIHTASANNLYVTMPNPPNHDHIYQGNHVVDRSVQKVYIPQPNFDYYKSLAKSQDSGSDQHFYDVGSTGTATLPTNITKAGISSMSVYYSTGNFTLSNSTWADTATNALFVCEGSFTCSGHYRLQANCKFQVVAGQDVNMTKTSTADFDNASTNSYFLFAKRDVNFYFTQYDNQGMQATALRDINLSTDDYSTCKFTYLPPQLDVSGWPIDVTVKDWKELPVDQ